MNVFTKLVISGHPPAASQAASSHIHSQQRISCSATDSTSKSSRCFLVYVILEVRMQQIELDSIIQELLIIQNISVYKLK